MPTASIGDAVVLEGNAGSTDLTFTVTLSAASASEVTVDFSTSDAGATAGADYIAASGVLTIPAGETNGAITVPVSGDTGFEANETFTLTLSNPFGATLAVASATGTIANDDPGGLNDTGITACGDYAYDASSNHNNNLDCAAVGATTSGNGSDSDGDPVPGGQDAHFGRDANPLTNSDVDGHAGFSYTRICNSGELAGEGDCPAVPVLGGGADGWGCTYDNVTGLVWEVKTSDSDLRDKDWTYTWYNSDANTNGGVAGTANSGSCYDSANCDTEKYLAQVNAAGLCGHSDWRLPSRMELKSLADLSIDYPGPAIDTGYFPNTQGSWYWSSSPYANGPNLAWNVVFDNGNDDANLKNYTYHVRLVRAGQ
ncbi:MAG: DUF1566 domain-containing protein [Desulfobulbales bacterium]|nr:DUF1566 domain-containing protein [Desulfobulbales bacterium]